MKIPWRRLDWINTSFLVGTHLVALVGTFLYFAYVGFTWGAIALTLFFLVATGLSITAGYHRLYSHRTYESHWSVRLVYLLFGAASYQNSALKWCFDHRRHHQQVDEEADPYNIRAGFWWAHMGWVFVKDPILFDERAVPDLIADPLVRWQHRWYIPLSIAMGFILPLSIGWLMGDPLGGIILAGFLRIVLNHHAAFCVNSLAHTIGRQPYSNSDSSRDSAVTAIVTLGEGYHNFHHTFPYDYRNGVGPHQYDPTKWLIRGLSFLRLTRNLKRVPLPVILKAQLSMDQRHLEESPWKDRLVAFRVKLEQLAERWQRLKEDYARLKSEFGRKAHDKIVAIKAELAQARREFREAWKLWVLAMRRPEILAASA